jgi:hypothetical protein
MWQVPLKMRGLRQSALEWLIVLELVDVWEMVSMYGSPFFSAVEASACLLARLQTVSDHI